MDDLFQKYKDALLTNESLTISNQKLKTQLTLLTEELNILKSKPTNPIDIQQQLDIQEKKFRTHLIQVKKYTRGLLGYDMELKGDTIELLSLYAFDKSDKIVFRVDGNNLDLLSNDFVDGYKEHIEMYIIKGKSIPAFLGSINMDLVSKRTTQ